MTTSTDLNPYLDKLLKGSLTEAERISLMGLLEEIERHPDCAAAERMAAMLMRASLEARRGHHDKPGPVTLEARS